MGISAPLGEGQQDGFPADQCPRRLPFTPLPALLELARHPHDGPFERRAISARVNSVRNDDPDVLTAAPDSRLF